MANDPMRGLTTHLNTCQRFCGLEIRNPAPKVMGIVSADNYLGNLASMHLGHDHPASERRLFIFLKTVRLKFEVGILRSCADEIIHLLHAAGSLMRI
jgi:hypothetical protein